MPCGTAASGVMSARGGVGACEFSGEKLNYGIIGVAFNAGKHPDSRPCERTERTRTDSAADDNID